MSKSVDEFIWLKIRPRFVPLKTKAGSMTASPWTYLYNSYEVYRIRLNCLEPGPSRYKQTLSTPLGLQHCLAPTVRIHWQFQHSVFLHSL